ncbi:uncharacterized protein M6B38_119835 [Iris pallida]|uniref:Reverse transcriptase zinc-binding domain-containing protein n=1 Tax=Iris pallida TaxID=29817 RepID=A0AAX6HA87_IRIPA|nr:uncharacterized protein M6B38_119835 [Iris pallida]
MAWRFIKGGSLWADWMANRYLRRTNFWACRIDNNFSVTFKAILRCRPVLQAAIRRQMKDGTTTDLWLDPWLGSRSLLDILGGQMDREAGRGLTCSRIIRDGVWRPEGCPHTAQLAEEIRLVTIDASQHEDSWSWAGPGTGGGSGLFCFRSCYDLVRTHHDQAEEVDFIWGKDVARKIQLCAYRLLRGRLMTRDRLLRFGMQIPDAKCVLCNDEDESMGHLFFGCPVTWHIWTEQCAQLRGGVGMDRDIQSILSWIRDHRGRDPGWARRARVRLAASVWHIWKERNRRIFEGLTTPLLEFYII